MNPSLASRQHSINPFLNLKYEPAFESLGADYYDEVFAAEFPQHILRWRNDELLPTLGLDPNRVTDEHFIDAFGRFVERSPLIAMRYHGYQFGIYNPRLGDGRGFLYGQVRGKDGQLYDFGTKGSGRTPYSRGGDGMLTLKGGVREVLAAEMLHRMGVRTSRCLSLVETGLELWRGDEPSPTRSAVMVRMSKSHIRFGTFERLNYLQRPDLIENLLNHTIAVYYPHLAGSEDRYARFYAELVERVAELVGQWMAVGFCHAVLNTDNMAITGESFDYGPYAFIPNYNPQFTAAYFDEYGRYAYGNQPVICKLNLELLQKPLGSFIPSDEMENALSRFESIYIREYRQRLLNKLGFTAEMNQQFALGEMAELYKATIDFLKTYPVSYHDFFADIARYFSDKWQDDASLILAESEIFQSLGRSDLFIHWSGLYHRCLNQLNADELQKTSIYLQRVNPATVIVRPVIESIWEPIVKEDNWQPFVNLLKQIQNV